MLVVRFAVGARNHGSIVYLVQNNAVFHENLSRLLKNNFYYSCLCFLHVHISTELPSPVELN